MEKCANVVIRILVAAVCIVLAVAGLYLYLLNTVNAYYTPAEGDLFFSSMAIKKIFPMNDGRVIVCGTYLTGDSVYGSPSVFFKSYDANGSLAKSASLTLDEGYDYSDAYSDGEIILLVAKGSSGSVKTYGITYGFDTVSIDDVPVSSAEITGIYAGLAHSESYVAEVRNGRFVKITTGNEVLLDTEITDDVFIDNVYFAGNTFFLTGTVTVGSDTFPYISGFSLSKVRKFATTVQEDLVDFTIDGVVFLSDGKTYITGKRFNSEAYMAALNNGGTDGDSAEIALMRNVAERAVVSKRDFGAVLVGGSAYREDPWCTRFICPIDADTGSVGNIQELLDDGPDFGITEIYYQDAYNLKKNASTDNPGGKPVIATLITKNAVSSSAENYTVNVYLLFGDMTTSKSANIIVPSDTYYYPGTAPDGSLFCYVGMTGKRDNVIYTMKKYSGTVSAAEAQQKLPKYKQAANYITTALTPRIIGYIGIFFLLYITARYRGTANALLEKETSRYR